VDLKESALVERVLSGDQEACVRLVNEYSRMAAAVTAALLDNATPLAWITSILSLCLSLFYIRRAPG
jgi:hypothetical protein